MKKWYALKINGSPEYVMKWDGKPEERDFHTVFGIAITPSSVYEVVEVDIVSAELIGILPKLYENYFPPLKETPFDYSREIN